MAINRDFLLTIWNRKTLYYGSLGKKDFIPLEEQSIVFSFPGKWNQYEESTVSYIFKILLDTNVFNILCSDIIQFRVIIESVKVNICGMMQNRFEQHEIIILTKVQQHNVLF